MAAFAPPTQTGTSAHLAPITCLLPTSTAGARYCRNGECKQPPKARSYRQGREVNLNP